MTEKKNLSFLLYKTTEDFLYGSVSQNQSFQGREVPKTTLGPVVTSVDSGVHNTSVSVALKISFSPSFVFKIGVNLGISFGERFP